MESQKLLLIENQSDLLPGDALLEDTRNGTGLEGTIYRPESPQSICFSSGGISRKPLVHDASQADMLGRLTKESHHPEASH